jgi:hypothetical protein
MSDERPSSRVESIRPALKQENASDRASEEALALLRLHVEDVLERLQPPPRGKQFPPKR